MSKKHQHHNGKITQVGHFVEYVDDRAEKDGTHKKHLALVKDIELGPNGKLLADLHVFHDEGHTSHEELVPHDVHEGPHSWDHSED